MIIKGLYSSDYMEIDNMFKNFTKCECCIRNQVYSFKTEQKELIDKIETHLNSDLPSKNFNIILECKNFLILF